MPRVSQEFYCGECQSYFIPKLNMGLNHEVEVVCPGCGHEHRRCIHDGVIYESGRYNTDAREKIISMKSTLSKKPRTQKMIEAQGKGYGGRRDGVVILAERWLELKINQTGG